MVNRLKKGHSAEIILFTIIVATFILGESLSFADNHTVAQDNDERILLTPDNITTYNPPEDPDCNKKFNTGSPDQIIHYRNPVQGIAFNVPYNDKWGSQDFRINPYDKTINMVEFGSMGIFEACSWLRDYRVDVIPQRSAQDAVQELGQELLVPPTIVHINNLTVIKYADSGLCPYYPTLEIVGAKQNYQFIPLCAQDLDNSFATLEEIVKSVELL